MKTKFLKKLKQIMFLLIAFLGTSNSYSQPISKTTISGNIKHGIGGSCDPGGGKSSDGGLQQLAKTSFILSLNFIPSFNVYSKEIEGRGSTIKDSYSGTSHIVINSDSARLAIGGGRGTSAGTGEFDMGVKSREPNKVGKVTLREFFSYRIGGKNTTGGLGELDSPYTIGGKETSTGITGQITNFEKGAGKSCYQGVGKSIFIVPLTFEIGGNNALPDSVERVIGGKWTIISSDQIHFNIIYC